MRTLRTASRADRDIIDEAVWFEQKQPALGADFLDAVDRALARILERPLSCPTLTIPSVNLKVELRWLRIGHFSHIAIFEVTDDEVVVYGIVDPRRDLEHLLIERIGIR